LQGLQIVEQRILVGEKKIRAPGEFTRLHLPHYRRQHNHKWGGNKKITALMLYAAVVALRSLASVALSSTTVLHRIQQDAVASKR